MQGPLFIREPICVVRPFSPGLGQVAFASTNGTKITRITLYQTNSASSVVTLRIMDTEASPNIVPFMEVTLTVNQFTNLHFDDLVLPNGYQLVFQVADNVQVTIHGGKLG